jgi:hypothetical protein
MDWRSGDNGPAHFTNDKMNRAFQRSSDQLVLLVCWYFVRGG